MQTIQGIQGLSDCKQHKRVHTAYIAGSTYRYTIWNSITYSDEVSGENGIDCGLAFDFSNRYFER